MEYFEWEGGDEEGEGGRVGEYGGVGVEEGGEKEVLEGRGGGEVGLGRGKGVEKRRYRVVEGWYR